MKTLVRRLWAEEEGQTLVEYALIIALVAVAVIGALTFLRGRISNVYNNAGNTLQ
ncbi:MAG: Flp family type IVb pilin [Armatimonadota bacterium]|nr:Flp family type IVb pilin [Armatimonadota bacterium]